MPQSAQDGPAEGGEVRPCRVEKAEVARPLCAAAKARVVEWPGWGGTSCMYQALFLSPYLGISFVSHPCDLQIGALVAGALIQLVWCGISVWPPGQGLGEFAPQGTQPLLASGPGMLTVVSSVVLALISHLAVRAIKAEGSPPLTPKRLCQRAGGSLFNLFQRRWRPAVVLLQLETEPKEMDLDCSRWGDLGWRQTIRNGFVAGGWLSGGSCRGLCGEGRGSGRVTRGGSRARLGQTGVVCNKPPGRVTS